MIIRNIIILLFLSFFNATVGQMPAFLSNKLQNTLDSLLVTSNTKGLSACIIDPRNGTWRGTAGVSFPNNSIKPEMQFGIASNTKLFTGIMILILEENGLLHLDDSIYHYLPKYQNIDTTISIRELLNHTSGIKDVNETPGYPDSIMNNTSRVYSANEIIQWIGPPSFQHGKGWEYSNTNYLLAGMIAEKVTGKKISTLIRDSILIPLKLDSTFFDVAEPVMGEKANPWHLGVNISPIPRISLNSAAGAAGAMYSNAGDMANWYQALMNGKIINANSMIELTTFVGSGNYSIGLAKQKLGGRTVYIHGGDIRGYRSQMLYDTALNISIALLCNSNPAPVTLIARELLLSIANYAPNGIAGGEINEIPVKVFPNPSNGIFNLTLPRGHQGYLEIFDQTGRLIDRTQDTIINISQQADGLYWLLCNDPKNKYKIPLIKFDYSY